MTASTGAPREASADEEFLAQLYKGGELLAAGKIVEAKEHLERAHALAPKNEKAQNLLGLTYFKLGLFDRASGIYEGLVNENPVDPTLRVNLGLVYLKTNALARAVKEFETATDLDPEHKKAHNYLGLALAQAGEYARAKEHFTRAGSDAMAEKMARALEAQAPPPANIAVTGPPPSAPPGLSPHSAALFVPPPPAPVPEVVAAAPPIEPPPPVRASAPRPAPEAGQEPMEVEDRQIEVMADEDGPPPDELPPEEAPLRSAAEIAEAAFPRVPRPPLPLPGFEQVPLGGDWGAQFGAEAPRPSRPQPSPTDEVGFADIKLAEDEGPSAMAAPSPATEEGPLLEATEVLVDAPPPEGYEAKGVVELAAAQVAGESVQPPPDEARWSTSGDPAWTAQAASPWSAGPTGAAAVEGDDAGWSAGREAAGPDGNQGSAWTGRGEAFAASASGEGADSALASATSEVSTDSAAATAEGSWSAGAEDSAAATAEGSWSAEDSAAATAEGSWSAGAEDSGAATDEGSWRAGAVDSAAGAATGWPDGAAAPATASATGEAAAWGEGDTVSTTAQGTWSEAAGGAPRAEAPEGAWSEAAGGAPRAEGSEAPEGAWSEAAGGAPPAEGAEAPQGAWSEAAGGAPRAEGSEAPEGAWSEAAGGAPPAEGAEAPEGAWSEAVGGALRTEGSEAPEGARSEAAGGAPRAEDSQGAWSEAFAPRAENSEASAATAEGAPWGERAPDSAPAGDGAWTEGATAAGPAGGAGASRGDDGSTWREGAAGSDEAWQVVAAAAAKLRRPAAAPSGAWTGVTTMGESAAQAQPPAKDRWAFAEATVFVAQDPVEGAASWGTAPAADDGSAAALAAEEAAANTWAGTGESAAQPAGGTDWTDPQATQTPIFGTGAGGARWASAPPPQEELTSEEAWLSGAAAADPSRAQTPAAGLGELPPRRAPSWEDTAEAVAVTAPLAVDIEVQREVVTAPGGVASVWGEGAQLFSPLQTRRMSELGPQAASALELGVDGPFHFGPQGLAVTVNGELLTRVAGLVAVAGAVEVAPQARRYRGRDTEQPFGEGTQQLQRATGRGVLHVELGSQQFQAIDLDDEGAYLREERVFAFEESIAFENGRLTAEGGLAVELVHLKGQGRLLLALEGPMNVMAVPTGSPLVVPLRRLVGWYGHVNPRLMGFAGQGAIELTGEGFALLGAS